MGLMQLLTVGRSLGRIHDQPSRYKMTQQCLLPKFGSASAPEDEACETSETTNQVFAKTDVQKCPPNNASAAIERKSMNAAQSAKPVTAAASEPASRPAFPRGRWSLFKNPFTKAAKPVPAKAPEQSELRLDAVKPVRNDLADADLELVQAARRVPAHGAQGTEQSPADGAAWNRIKTQFFGTGKA